MKLSTFMDIIPGQKLCKRCKTNANAIINKESNDEVNDEIFNLTHSCKKVERNNFNGSAEALGFPSIKPVGKRNILSFGPQESQV